MGNTQSLCEIEATCFSYESFQNSVSGGIEHAKDLLMDCAIHSEETHCLVMKMDLVMFDVYSDCKAGLDCIRSYTCKKLT